MEHEQYINNTILFVKEQLKQAESGHDWWHIHRVWKLAKTICKTEKCCAKVVDFAALLHDIADSKFYNGDETVGPKIAYDFLTSQSVSELIVTHVVKIIENVSFKGGNFKSDFESIELNIVKDADRLDAMGAIGIARTFNYGGFKKRQIYDPNIVPNLTMSKEEYKASEAPTINHFYEKLLLLKDKMNTQTAMKLAIQRHEFMEQYLKQFYLEWNGEL